MSVPYALLALLSEGPKYGMQLRDEYEGATGDVWPLNVGQVYTTLQRLERDGLVESAAGAEDERHRLYRITDLGEVDLREWLTTPPDPGSPPRDELVTKVLVALHVPGIHARKVIQAHRRQVLELMQQWTSLKQDEGELDLPFRLMLEAELTRLGAIATWLDTADALVMRAARKGSPTRSPTSRRPVVSRLRANALEPEVSPTG